MEVRKYINQLPFLGILTLGIFTVFICIIILFSMSGKQFSQNKSQKEIDIIHGWTIRTVGGKNIAYTLKKDFGACPVINNIKENGANGKVIAPLAHTSRLDFFEALLVNHCITYEKTDISEVTFADIAEHDIKTKQIAQTAINLGIAQGYEVHGNKVFRAKKKVARIEAIAVLLKLSGLELKDTGITYSFADVEKNWKSDIASTAHHLQLTPIDAKENLFSPDYIMKKRDTFELMMKMAQYY